MDAGTRSSILLPFVMSIRKSSGRKTMNEVLVSDRMWKSLDSISI